MLKHILSSRSQRAGMFRSISRQMIGGDWALSHPKDVRKNLRRFWFDGFFSSACDNILITYLSLYILALGATNAQIGLLSSFSSLVAALTLLPAALLVEKIGQRKKIVVAGASINRLAVLLLAVLPLLLSGKSLVIIAIVFVLMRDFGSNLIYPAWVSMTADIVPLEGRGRYFASRNFAMGVAGMGVTLIAGELITRSDLLQGYQLALGAAFFFGTINILFFSRISEPLPSSIVQNPRSLGFRAAFGDLRKEPAFLIVAGTAALWNLSLNIAGPFFNVHMVQNLDASATMVALTTIASILAGLLAQRKLGYIVDRWGASRLQMISGLLIPILPLSWAFVTEPWQIIPINLVGGVLWGAYNLASFNYLLTVIPEGYRERYSAIYQVVVMVSLSIGAAAGGVIVTRWGFFAVFIASSCVRLLAAFLFWYFINRRTKELQFGHYSS